MTELMDAAGLDWFAAMQAGDFPAAWRASDRVLALRPRTGRDDRAEPYHLRWVWDGSDVTGRDVLVRCYHGLGDSLQFCRFLPALRRRAARVTLELQPELIPLVSRLDACDRIVPFDPAAPLPPGGCDVEIMELCHALRLPPEPAPYLSVPSPRRSARPGGVGLCWRVQAGWRPERSIPVERLAGLLDGRTGWQSLQPGAAPYGMAPCPDALNDTAAVIAGLDLVITVDTMVAHLAGAIGTPVWLLLDSDPDWRWRAGGPGASPWYRSIRKYRQERAGDWEAPLRALHVDLTRRAPMGTVEV